MAAMVTFRFSPHSYLFTQKFVKFQKNLTSFFSSSRINPRNLSFFAQSILQNGEAASTPDNLPSTSVVKDCPLSGLEDITVGYMFGKKKATEVAHSVWKHVVQKGDTLVDATCGNGYDTLAMVKMVADKSRMGRVYAMDIQKVALENTLSLLDESLNPDEKELVELFAICHSKMEEVVPNGISVRLVAFNLGYLPGGDKAIITASETTLLALEAAKRILAPGGLISIVVYVGHPGGREEYERVKAFASELSVENWISCKLQILNRPLAPILVFIFKR
uniref:rRNA methylase YtqB n=1 Tax=Davidia involucrata TaxID=16924 RepID=A0A5B7BLB8_DAVIN